MAHYKCTECGLIFSFSIVQEYVRKNYEAMAKLGTLTKEAYEKIDAESPISRAKLFIHPSWITPHCPRCGAKSVWIGKVIKRKVKKISEEETLEL